MKILFLKKKKKCLRNKNTEERKVKVRKTKDIVRL